MKIAAVLASDSAGEVDGPGESAAGEHGDAGRDAALGEMMPVELT